MSARASATCSRGVACLSRSWSDVTPPRSAARASDRRSRPARAASSVTSISRRSPATLLRMRPIKHDVKATATGPGEHAPRLSTRRRALGAGTSLDLPERRAGRRGRRRRRRGARHRSPRPLHRPGAALAALRDPASAPRAERSCGGPRLVARAHRRRCRPPRRHRRRGLSRGPRRGRWPAVAGGGPVWTVSRRPAALGRTGDDAGGCPRGTR